MGLPELIDALEAGAACREPAALAATLYGAHTSAETAWAGIRRNPLLAPSLEVLAQKAARFRKEPVVSLPFSLYRRFDTDGNRTAYEAAYFLHRSRLNTFALLTLAGEADALPELEDAIWQICDEYTWSLPAHLGGRSLDPALVRGHGALPLSLDWPSGAASVPHDQQIDLFAAETAFALSEILALLDDRLAPVVRARAQAHIRERVLAPLQAPGPAWNWETMRNNWAAVCAGSIGCAAMYLLSDPRRLAPVLHRMTAAMDVFLSSFGEDGACAEGHGYWNYGFGFFIAYAERLRTRTGGRIDLTADPKVHAIARFQQRIWLGGNRIVSFSDADRTGGWQPGLTHWLRRRFPDVTAPDPVGVQHFGDDPCHRWCVDLRSFLWANPVEDNPVQEASMQAETAQADPVMRDPAPCDPVPRVSEDSIWFPDAQWLISHAAAQGHVLHFAAKAGHNDEPHNHNDVGAFLLHCDDEPFLEDMGRDEYTKAYFGPNRYDLPATGSHGHCVPLVGDAVQQAGRSHEGTVRHLELTPAADRFTVEMAGAYGIAELAGLERTWCLCRDGMPRLELEDRFRFARPGIGLTERFVTFLDPVQAGEDVLLAGKTGTLRIMPLSPGFRIRLHQVSMPCSSGEPRVLRIVDFIGEAAGEDAVFRATFRFEPVRNG